MPENEYRVWLTVVDEMTVQAQNEEDAGRRAEALATRCGGVVLGVEELQK